MLVECEQRVEEVLMEEIVTEALNKGVELHIAGEYDLASQLYESVIKLQPNHADANHNMGLLKLDMGDDLEALPYLQTALQLDTSIAQFWLSYIKALIKLEKLEDAARILDLAKENGIESEEFVELIQLINPPTEIAKVSEREVDKPSQSKPNILDSLKLNQALRLAEKKAKEGNTEEALRIYKDILAKFPKNKQAQHGLAAFNEPPQEITNQLINLYSQGQLHAAAEKANEIIKYYPRAFMAWNIFGMASLGLGKVSEALEAFKRVTEANPTYADGYRNLGVALEAENKLDEAVAVYSQSLKIKPNDAEVYRNMGNALKEQGKLGEAINAYDKAISFKTDYADAYYNKGNTLQDQGKLEEAIRSYKKALSLKPDYADVYNNLGMTLKEQGKLDEALEAYNKTLAVKPDYAGVYNNISITLQEQGNLDEAIASYNKALSLKPDYAEAHRNLSLIKKYFHGDPQIISVAELIKRNTLSDHDRCQLHYTYAKMQEDLDDLSSAFEHYSSGGKLRKKLLSYELIQDRLRFQQIKNTAIKFKILDLPHPFEASINNPIFVLGMPRSGTTLVEQIISSHSQVTGAGELQFLERYGDQLVFESHEINPDIVLQIRTAYLRNLNKVSSGKPFVTDKLPHNFYYIALILKALPEAKIIHVKRDPAATCWSNFKHYFSSDGLGYSYDLENTVSYYKLYQDLMEFWDKQYGRQIYHLDYDRLTIEQENETRKLIQYLELAWEDTCLSPQDNKRGVRTASQQQVRKKIYKGSSQDWRKFEPYLNGIFDEFYYTEQPPRK